MENPEKGTESEYFCDVCEDEPLLHDGDGGYYCECCDGDVMEDESDEDCLSDEELQEESTVKNIADLNALKMVFKASNKKED